jgi:predicted phosphodiesterase
MRLAIVSDIHSNRHALEAVLEEIDSSEIDELICLGDLVGYGADPDASVELVKSRAALSLCGNHDLGVTGELSLSAFSSSAFTAARWTANTINPTTMEYLSSLRPSGEAHGLGLFHASPRDPIWEYVLSDDVAGGSMDVSPFRVSLVGHSHVALSFHRGKDEVVTGSAMTNGEEISFSDGEWILNPGSVGQPRDTDPRAAWMLLDTESQTANWHRIEYDIDGAAAAIREAGLPVSLGERLYIGQ